MSGPTQHQSESRDSLMPLESRHESQFPEMERYYKAALSIPLYADLEEDDVKKVCEELIKATSL